MISKTINRKQKFLLNTSWIIMERVIQMVVQLLVGIISVRYLGPENYGTISYVNSFIALFNSICTLGLDGVVIKKIIEEPSEVGEIIGTSIIMRVISSTISIICILSMMYIIEGADKLLLTLGILQSISLVFMSFEVIDFWFQSQLNSKYTSIAKSIATLIVAIWKVYLLITAKSVEYFAVSTTIQYIVIAVMLYFLYFKEGGKKLQVSYKRAKILIGESYHFILSGLMVVLYTQMDKIMIGKMIDSTQVGIYTAASNIPGMYMFIFMAVINSARPVILEEKNNNEKLYIRRVKQLYSFIIWSNIAISIVMLFSSKFIMLILYGKDYLSGCDVLLIATCTNVFSVLGSARGIWIVAENKQEYVKKMLIWGAIVNIILNLVFIPIYGIFGAAVSTLITQVTTCILAPMFYKETRIHTKYIYDSLMMSWRKR